MNPKFQLQLQPVVLKYVQKMNNEINAFRLKTAIEKATGEKPEKGKTLFDWLCLLEDRVIRMVLQMDEFTFARVSDDDLVEILKGQPHHRDDPTDKFRVRYRRLCNRFGLSTKPMLISKQKGYHKSNYVKQVQRKSKKEMMGHARLVGVIAMINSSLADESVPASERLTLLEMKKELEKAIGI